MRVEDGWPAPATTPHETDPTPVAVAKSSLESQAQNAFRFFQDNTLTFLQNAHPVWLIMFGVCLTLGLVMPWWWARLVSLICAVLYWRLAHEECP